MRCFEFGQLDKWFCVAVLVASAIATNAADTVFTNQIGMGVIYRHYHYDALYSSKQEIYITDLNLNDPAPYVKFPALTGGAMRTVSAHAATVTGAIACVNGQFFNSTTGSIQFLKVNDAVLNVTQTAVHDEQGVTDDGARHTNSVGVTLRPGGGWASLSTSNIMTSGPDLIRNGAKFTSYDFNDSLVTNRNPRTCAAWTYDNHLLLTVVDGRSSAAAGMTLPELRDYLFTNYPVRNAFNLDGGGSSTMWVTGAVMNVPSDGSQRSVADAIAVVAPKPAIPAAPANLAAVVSGTNAYLAWSLASGAMSYKLKRSTTNGGPYATIAQTVTTSYSNTNLLPGTAYYYVVTAVNTVGESTNSLQVNALTVPLAPAGLSAAAGNTQAILSWNPANFAAGYKLKRATVSGGPYTPVATIGSTASTNTGLANGATYYFVVSATNTAGEGANSGQVSVMPQCFTPAIPGGLNAAMGGGQINLKWHSVSGAQSYTIQRSTTNGGPFSVLAAGIITTNIADPAASFGTVYFYTVAASNVCGLSASSSEVSVPLLITSTIMTPGNIIFGGWGGVPGAAYYLLSSTDPALPTTNWTILGTNVFGAGGSFQVTNISQPKLPQQYFRVRTTAP